MRYMCLIYSDEKQDIPYGTPEWDQLMVEYRAFGAEATRRNAIITGDPLQNTETATTLRQQGGKSVILDGPFAETREQLGGFYILDCKDQGEVLELAAMIPSAKRGSIEVRPMAGHERRFLEPEQRTRYMLLIYGQEANFLPVEDPRVMDGIGQHQRLTSEMIENGEFIAGDGLALTTDAVTVRVRDGKALHTDGPFAETREQLGGFYMINVSDLDRALELARRLPIENGCIEIRPVLEV